MYNYNKGTCIITLPRFYFNVFYFKNLFLLIFVKYLYCCASPVVEPKWFLLRKEQLHFSSVVNHPQNCRLISI